MIAKLSVIARITVEALRANRTLRVELTGEISADLRGDLSGLRGDLSGLWGDLSGLRGDLSGLRGEIPADLAGDIDACEISEQEREHGVDISTLIADSAA